MGRGPTDRYGARVTTVDAVHGAPGLRASAAGGAAVALACEAHVLAGGGAPPVAGVLALLLVTVPALRAALGSRPTPRRMVLALVGAQAVLHVAFSVAVAATSSPSGSMSDVGHGMVVATGDGAPHGTWAIAAHHLVAGTGGVAMLALHLVAAAALGLWLAAGDQVLTTLLHLVRAPRTARYARAWSALLAAALRLANETYRRLLMPRRSDPGTAPRPDPAVVSVVVRRGPPALLPVVPA